MKNRWKHAITFPRNKTALKTLSSLVIKLKPWQGRQQRSCPLNWQLMKHKLTTHTGTLLKGKRGRKRGKRRTGEAEGGMEREGFAFPSNTCPGGNCWIPRGSSLFTAEAPPYFFLRGLCQPAFPPPGNKPPLFPQPHPHLFLVFLLHFISVFKMFWPHPQIRKGQKI